MSEEIVMVGPMAHCMRQRIRDAMPHRIIPIGIFAPMNPREFFRELLRRRNLTTTGLARALQAAGKTETNLQPNLNKWLNDPAMEPEVKTMLPVADFFAVNLGAFYRPKEAQAEMRRLDGLGQMAEPSGDVISIKQLPHPFSQALFDDLPEQQRQDVAKIAADVVDAFTRYNGRGKWDLPTNGRPKPVGPNLSRKRKTGSRRSG